jgi:hypothetical protein
MKYLVTYMGRVSGSFMGRDDGYPELKTAVLAKDSDLLRYTMSDAKFYLLTPTDVSSIFLKEKQELENKKSLMQKQKQQALNKLSPTERKILGV